MIESFIIALIVFLAFLPGFYALLRLRKTSIEVFEAIFEELYAVSDNRYQDDPWCWREVSHNCVKHLKERVDDLTI